MPFSKEIMKGISETVVLKILHDLTSAYGYQLIKAINAASGDTFSFHEGTLYPLLYRLEVKKLVRSTTKTAPSGKTRRYYALTSQGRRALRQQSAALKKLHFGLRQILSLSI